jgi:hypothetical protein
MSRADIAFWTATRHLVRKAANSEMCKAYETVIAHTEERVEHFLAAGDGMSALLPIATAKADSRKRSCPLYPRDMCGAARNVRFGPKADMGRHDPT